MVISAAELYGLLRGGCYEKKTTARSMNLLLLRATATVL